MQSPALLEMFDWNSIKKVEINLANFREMACQAPSLAEEHCYGGPVCSASRSQVVPIVSRVGNVDQKATKKHNKN
jgi:hypothetical protein